MRYAIVIERAGNNFGAYVPDLPGCVSTGYTVAEVEANIREAIEVHIEPQQAMVGEGCECRIVVDVDVASSSRWDAACPDIVDATA